MQRWSSVVEHLLSLRVPEFHLSIHTKKEQKLESTVLNHKFKIFCFRIKHALWCLLWMCYVGNEGVHVCVFPRHHNVFKDNKSTRCGDFNGTVLVTLSYLAQKANTECFICILTININSQICYPPVISRYLYMYRLKHARAKRQQASRSLQEAGETEAGKLIEMLDHRFWCDDKPNQAGGLVGKAAVAVVCRVRQQQHLLLLLLHHSWNGATTSSPTQEEKHETHRQTKGR